MIVKYIVPHFLRNIYLAVIVSSMKDYGMYTSNNESELAKSFIPKKRFYIKVSETMNAYLTKKEFDIVLHLVNGRRAKEIAWELGSSLHTINTHLANIKYKLKCANIFQLGLVLGKSYSDLDAFLKHYKECEDCKS